jgi:hypothetical protein
MSYAAAAALQATIYGALSAAPALSGVSIVDAMPPGTTPGTFILIGPEVAVDQSDGTGAGAEHRFTVSVISDATGFLTAKSVASAASAAVLAGGLSLTTGHLVSINFQRAVARRLEEGSTRRIDMTFRARVEL